MAIFSVPDIKISGVAACVPEDVYYNENYDWIEEKERKNLIKTIGVVEKHHARQGTTTADLCFDAGMKLLQQLQWNPIDVELIIFIFRFIFICAIIFGVALIDFFFQIIFKD